MIQKANHLLEVAIDAALSAGAFIRQKRHETIALQHKEAGSSYATQVVTEIDRSAERLILKELLPTCTSQNMALLSEETPDDQQRFEKDYFWCVDPLDGTLAFIENRPDYSVSIGLVSKAGVPVIGVIYDPSRDNLYHAVRGEGAFKNGKPWIIEPTNNHLTYVTDHRLEKAYKPEKIRELIDAKLQAIHLNEVQVISGGGLVINAMRTAENGPAFMAKLPKPEQGGGSLWDYAAAACICLELGMKVGGYHGEPLELNKKRDTYLNHQGMYFENFPKSNWA